jgi:hypothetical protein
VGRGPILLSGDYGPACIGGKHCVLVVGLSGTNNIVYFDPFLIGMKAIAGNHYTYVSVLDAFKRLTVTLGVRSLYQAEPGYGAGDGVVEAA